MSINSPTTPAEQLLGTVDTVIAGSQYCDADAEAGDMLTLEREPSNQHDANAVRIDNEAFEKVGYLPRRIVSWLAPLIDDGRVIADATAAQPDGHEEHDFPPVSLKLYLSHKGAAILDVWPDPENDLQALHRAVLETYLAAGDWTHPQVVSAVGKRLASLFKKELLPETKMLLLLFPHRAGEAAGKSAGRSLDTARDFVSSLEIKEAVTCNNLSVFPIFHPGAGVSAYDLLKVALEDGSAEVTEMSESGVVSELKVVNRGQRRLLIPEGEMLTGAKQDRVVNVTVLVAAFATFTLPVSCVEQGRWSHVSDNFQATHYAPHSLRARRNESVRADRMSGGSGHSDQGRVWADIQDTMDGMNLDSATGSLPEAYEKAESLLEQFRKKVKMPAGCRGAVVAVNNEIYGMDYYDDGDAFAKMWPVMSQSYFFEAVRRKSDGTTATKDQAVEYLDNVRASLDLSPGTLGEGVELYVKHDTLTGSAILSDERLCHLTASTSL